MNNQYINNIIYIHRHTHPICEFMLNEERITNQVVFSPYQFWFDKKESYMYNYDYLFLESGLSSTEFDNEYHHITCLQYPKSSRYLYGGSRDS